jgi:hypothetical protein
MAEDYNIELCKAKPFAKYTQVELASIAEQILGKLPKSFEGAQFHPLMEPLSYLWKLLRKPQRTKLNTAMNAHVAGLQAVRWLPKVKALIEKQSFKKTKSGSGHVYFILLDQTRFVTTNKLTRCGIYIGQSKYIPHKRFKQHKAGIHASGEVRRNGKYILNSLSYKFTPINIAEAKRLEAECYEIICAAKLTYLPRKIVQGGH